MNIYVGNLSYRISDRELREIFESYGEVTSATVIVDKFTGDSRGFGFVEMPSKEEAQRAIAELNDTDQQGRTIRVNEARPREDRRGGRGGGGGDRRGGDRGHKRF